MSTDTNTETSTDTARSARRSTVDLLRDGGYATIGATDAAVAYVRRLGERAEQVRVDLPALKTLRNPTELSASLRELGGQVEERFGVLAGRGREVVESLQRNRPMRAAVTRTRVARSQVKAAATSVRSAGEATAEAVEEGVAAVGDHAATDYEELTAAELRDLARDRGIAGHSTMNKAQLIAALRDA